MGESDQDIYQNESPQGQGDEALWFTVIPFSVAVVLKNRCLGFVV